MNIAHFNKKLRSIALRLQEVLPPSVYRMLLHIFTQLFFLIYARKNILKKNRALKGAGKGKRAFLLATGPSINQENLKLLAGEDCFSISNFYLHPDIQTINPLFHGFAPYHEPMILENYVEWLRQADSALPRHTKILLGHKTFDIVQKFGLFPEREIYYLYLAPSAKKNSVNLEQPILAPQTGPLLLLPLLIYMGYEHIYLLGCDHTTLRDYRKNITNFYRPEKDIRINATNSNVWFDIEIELRATLTLIEQYKFYKNMLTSTPKKITNLSVDSWLEMFPFERLEHVMTEPD